MELLRRIGSRPLPALLAFAMAGGIVTAAGFATDAPAGTPRALWAKRVVKAPAVAPSLSGDTLWVVGTDRKIRSHDGQTGKRHWKRTLPGHAALPALPAPGLLLVGVGIPEPSVVALDRATGRERWIRRTRRTPIGIEVSGGIVLVAAGTVVEALDRSGGSVRWRRDLGSEIAGIVVTGGRLFVLARRDSLWSLGPEAGETEWSVGVDGLHAAAPLAVDAMLIRVTYDGELVLHDLRTGEERARRTVPKPQVSSPAAVDGMIATAASGGEIEILLLPSLERRWLAQRKETIAAGARAWGSWWIVPTLRGHVLALTRSEGATEWSLRFPDPITWPAAASAALLALVDDRGRAVVYRLEGS